MDKETGLHAWSKILSEVGRSTRNFPLVSGNRLSSSVGNLSSKMYLYFGTLFGWQGNRLYFFMGIAFSRFSETENSSLVEPTRCRNNSRLHGQTTGVRPHGSGEGLL